MVGFIRLVSLCVLEHLFEKFLMVLGVVVDCVYLWGNQSATTSLLASGQLSVGLGVEFGAKGVPRVEFLGAEEVLVSNSCESRGANWGGAFVQNSWSALDDILALGCLREWPKH